MPLRFEIRVNYNELPAIARRLRDGARRIVREAAQETEIRAKALAPVRTGALRASILAEPESDTAWIVAPHVEYAIFQELGTYRMPPRPYMTPAAEAVRPTFLARMRNLPGEAANGD